MRVNWSVLFTVHFWWYIGAGGAVLGMIPLGLLALVFPFEFGDIPDPIVGIFLLAGILTVAVGLLLGT